MFSGRPLTLLVPSHKGFFISTQVYFSHLEDSIASPKVYYMYPRGSRPTKSVVSKKKKKIEFINNAKPVCVDMTMAVSRKRPFFSFNHWWGISCSARKFSHSLSTCDLNDRAPLLLYYIIKSPFSSFLYLQASTSSPTRIFFVSCWISFPNFSIISHSHTTRKYYAHV